MLFGDDRMLGGDKKQEMRVLLEKHGIAIKVA